MEHGHKKTLGNLTFNLSLLSFAVANPKNLGFAPEDKSKKLGIAPEDTSKNPWPAPETSKQ
jgi:hypothetical protein